MNEEILDQIKTRLEIGAKKYGEELDPNDGREWIQESIEEVLDTCVYLAAKLLQIKKTELNYKGPPYSMASNNGKKEPIKRSSHEVKLIHESLEEASANVYIDAGISDRYAELKELAKRLKEAGKL